VRAVPSETVRLIGGEGDLCQRLRKRGTDVGEDRGDRRGYVHQILPFNIAGQALDRHVELQEQMVHFVLSVCSEVCPSRAGGLNLA